MYVIDVLCKVVEVLWLILFVLPVVDVLFEVVVALRLERFLLHDVDVLWEEGDVFLLEFELT